MESIYRGYIILPDQIDKLWTVYEMKANNLYVTCVIT